jgi:hypothetical protein
MVWVGSRAAFVWQVDHPACLCRRAIHDQRSPVGLQPWKPHLGKGIRAKQRMNVAVHCD